MTFIDVLPGLIVFIVYTVGCIGVGYLQAKRDGFDE